jgi:hypothetical protein
MRRTPLPAAQLYIALKQRLASRFIVIFGEWETNCTDVPHVAFCPLRQH